MTGEPLSVGRKTRTISRAAAPRRSMPATRAAAFPAARTTRYLDAHHVEHWANGGETKLSNLVSFCRFHHRAVHEGGIRIEILDDGALRFVRPDGKVIDSIAPGFTQPRGDWKKRPVGTAASNRWAGERIDYGLGVEVLLQARRGQRSRGERVESRSSGRGMWWDARPGLIKAAIRATPTPEPPAVVEMQALHLPASAPRRAVSDIRADRPESATAWRAHARSANRQTPRAVRGAAPRPVRRPAAARDLRSHHRPPPPATGRPRAAVRRAPAGVASR